MVKKSVSFVVGKKCFIDKKEHDDVNPPNHNNFIGGGRGTMAQ